MWTVMVVDDERPNLDQLGDLLEKEERVRQVYRFQRPREALDRVVELQPDLVFLDIEMPGMKGLELAERIQELEVDAEIVFVTAYNQHAVAAFELFALDYILKPFHPSRLQQTLGRFEQVLRRSSEQRRSGGPQVGEEESPVASTFASDEDRSDLLEWASKVTIRMFGALEVTGEHGQVVWGSSKAIELFAYLLLHRHASNAQMLEDVFGEHGPEKATYYLHTSLYRVRKSLKDCGLDRFIEIVYRNKRYETTVAPEVFFDYEQFLQSPEAEQRVELYRGELLPEVGAHWLHVEQKRCADLYALSLQEAIRSARARGDADKLNWYRLRQQWLEEV